ncbi:ATPase [Mycobacterium asiaticum]|uniref:ATPase n=2 Tax=Mycobacterium asiaticum TaxID=1790 RepID=A0A1A3NTH4_MYCAS|nr:ATPase [Mycobacterium asiaticum]
MGAVQLRMFLATMMVAGSLVIALVVVVPTSASAEPETCPPVCDQIPNTAWIAPGAVPLHSVYRWPALAAVATPVTGTTPQFRFEQVCNALPQDSRRAAVSARATVAHPDGQWQLQAQILHWRGDTARGGAAAAAVFGTAVDALRGCQLGAPAQAPSVTDDEPTRMAAVISGPVIVHTYLVAHVASSTISELTLWAVGTAEVTWPVISDAAVLDAITAPLCEAYLASCP